MNKVFVLAPQEDWIVDRFAREWSVDNSDITVKSPQDADVIWLFADWCFEQLPLSLLERKKVITTIHHIVPEKFDTNAKRQFEKRDTVTDVYHVPNEHTKVFISEHTSKPISVISYWANNKIWLYTSDKKDIRKKYDIPENAFVIGSFQRDTEGHDLKSPKLEKGPDLLADYVENLSKNRQDILVLLGGWRRQYIKKRLSDAGIQYKYWELPSQPTINELYQTLDLYPVSARYEGGPQSLIECGLLNVPVVSRDVGIARNVLPESAINNDLSKATAAIPNVAHLKLPDGYAPYRKLIEEL